MFWCKAHKDDNIKSQKKKDKGSKDYSKMDQTNSSDKNNINRGQFRREVEENNNKIRTLAQSIKYVNNLSEIQKVPYPKFYFSSIKKYFAPNLTEWQKDQNSNIILQNTISAYHQLARSKKMERELTLSIHFYLEIIKRILRNQHHDEDTLAALNQNSENLRNYSCNLLRSFQDIIRLAKKAVTKEDDNRNQYIINQIRQLKCLMLKKEDILPSLAAISNQIDDINISKGHGSNHDTSHNYPHGQLPQKYAIEQLEKAYRKEQEMYNQNKRYWVNEVGEKNVHIAQLQEIIRRLSLKLQKNQKYSQTQFLKSEIDRLQTELKQKEKKEQDLMDKLNDKSYKLKLCEQINQFYKDHQEDHRIKLAQMSKKIVKARQTNARNIQLNKEVSKLTQTIMGLQKSLNQKESIDKYPNSNTNQLIAQLQIEKNRNKQLQEQLNRCVQKLDALKSFVGEEKKMIFGGGLLQNRRQQKNYLLQCIQNQKKMNVRQTRLLYQLERDGQVNFIGRLNGVANILLLIKTYNAFFACFYSGVYQQYGSMHEDALIISLDSFKFYPLRNRMGRAIIYDKDFLIFGNQQVKIKAGYKKVKSNFGSPNGFFDSKKDTVNALLKAGNSNQAEVLNYQIYEVFFQDKFKNNDWV